MVWFIFLTKIELLNMLVYPNKYDIVCVNLTIYIFSIGLQLSFSAMLFLDQIISMKYLSGWILQM